MSTKRMGEKLFGGFPKKKKWTEGIKRGMKGEIVSTRDLPKKK